MDKYVKTTDDLLVELLEQWKRLNPDEPLDKFIDFLNKYVFPFVHEKIKEELEKEC